MKECGAPRVALPFATGQHHPLQQQQSHQPRRAPIRAEEALAIMLQNTILALGPESCPNGAPLPAGAPGWGRQGSRERRRGPREGGGAGGVGGCRGKSLPLPAAAAARPALPAPPGLRGVAGGVSADRVRCLWTPEHKSCGETALCLLALARPRLGGALTAI